MNFPMWFYGFEALILQLIFDSSATIILLESQNLLMDLFYPSSFLNGGKLVLQFMKLIGVPFAWIIFFSFQSLKYSLLQTLQM